MTFDINVDRLLEYGVIGIAILAFIGIIAVIVITNRKGSILSFSQSKGSRLFCLFLAVFFLLVGFFYQTVKMFVISGALFLYAFGSPKILKQLQKESSPERKTENSQQLFSDGIGINSMSMTVQEEQRRKRIRKAFLNILKYVSWVGITFAMIYGFYLIRFYQPILDSNLVLVLILGVLFGSLAALFFLNRMFNRLVR